LFSKIARSPPAIVRQHALSKYFGSVTRAHESASFHARSNEAANFSQPGGKS
jgi:hypothetical protein